MRTHDKYEKRKYDLGHDDACYYITQDHFHGPLFTTQVSLTHSTCMHD